MDENANVREWIDGIDGSDAALGTAPARGASWDVMLDVIVRGSSKNAVCCSLRRSARDTVCAD